MLKMVVMMLMLLMMLKRLASSRDPSYRCDKQLPRALIATQLPRPLLWNDVHCDDEDAQNFVNDSNEDDDDDNEDEDEPDQPSLWSQMWSSMRLLHHGASYNQEVAHWILNHQIAHRIGLICHFKVFSSNIKSIRWRFKALWGYINKNLECS